MRELNQGIQFLVLGTDAAASGLAEPEQACHPEKRGMETMQDQFAEEN